MDAEAVAAEVAVQVSKLELKCNGTEILVIKSDDVSEKVVAAVRDHLRKQFGPAAKIAILAIDTDSEVSLFRLNE